MGRNKSTNPLDCSVAIRCDRESKEFFESIAKARGITVSKLLLGLISEGAKLERERRERLRSEARNLLLL